MDDACWVALQTNTLDKHIDNGEDESVYLVVDVLLIVACLARFGSGAKTITSLSMETGKTRRVGIFNERAAWLLIHDLRTCAVSGLYDERIVSKAYEVVNVLPRTSVILSHNPAPSKAPRANLQRLLHSTFAEGRIGKVSRHQIEASHSAHWWVKGFIVCALPPVRHCQAASIVTCDSLLSLPA